MLNTGNYLFRYIGIFFLGFFDLITTRKFENMIEYHIKENQPAGLVIGKIYDNIKSHSNPIWFLATEDSLRFLLSEENDNFSLDSKTGFLKSKKVIDLEQLCPKYCSNERGIVNLTVNIWTLDKLQGIAKISIVIFDVNDNVPFFDPSEIKILIKEMVYTTGKTIDLPRAIDHDISSLYNKIEYKLKKPSDYFELEIKNAVQPFLVLKKTMDSEVVDFFELCLLASNNDNTSFRPAELLIKITVLDINDNEPSFFKSIYLVPVPESSAVGAIIYELKATDPDKKSRLTYSSIPENPPSISSMFKVEGNGSVRLLRSLDYETQQFYQMSVRVTDGEFNAFTKVKIVVMDINDQAPQFNVNPSKITVFENSEVREIAQLSVIDRDSEDINGVITCFEPQELRSNQIVSFKAHPTNEVLYTLQLMKVLDRDISGGDSQHALFICHDNGIPTSLTSTYTVTIHVQDRNDNAPVFRIYSSYIEVKENAPITDVIYKFLAFDIDKDDNGRIVYEVFSNVTDDKCCFINPNSGYLYPKKSFDREQRSFYQIMITATDQAIFEPRFTTSIHVNITIIDENDEVPRLIGPNTLSIYENEPPLTLIGKLLAKDDDYESNGQVKYSLVQSPKSHYFYMSENGSLYSRTKFDREKNDKYCIPINIEDLGTPVSNEVKTTICILILDKNDNEPMITLPDFEKTFYQSSQTISDAFYQINISIYSLIKHPFAKVDVHDEDINENSNITLYLIPLFSNTIRISKIISLDTISRTFILLDNPNLSEIGCYKYKLSASDSGQPKLSSEKNLLICLTEKILNPRIREKEKDQTVSKANILIVIILAGTSAFLTALLVSAILCMIQPCKNLRRRQSQQSEYMGELSQCNPNETSINSRLKSPKKAEEDISEKILDKKLDMDFNVPDECVNNNTWTSKLVQDRDHKYVAHMMSQPQFIPGSEEQRSDSGRGASDEDNIITPLSNISRIAQLNHNFLMNPLLSMKSYNPKDFGDTKVLQNCGCESLQTSPICSIPNILQQSINMHVLKILSSGSYINSEHETITQSSSLLPHRSCDYIVENSLYNDTNVGNPNIFYPGDPSLQNISDLSTHIDKLFFSHCCKKY